MKRDDRSDVWSDILRLSRLVDAYLYGIDRDKLEKNLTASQLRGIQTTLTNLTHKLHSYQEAEANRE